jgi:hypothetical protein
VRLGELEQAYLGGKLAPRGLADNFFRPHAASRSFSSSRFIQRRAEGVKSRPKAISSLRRVREYSICADYRGEKAGKRQEG